jgi:transposase
MAHRQHPSQDLKVSILKSVRAGISIQTLSNIHKLHRVTIHRWIRERKAGHNFSRKKSPGSGRPPKISGSTARKLLEIVDKPASDFGFETDLWDTKRVRLICKKELGIRVSHMAVWRFFKKIDYSCKKVQKKYYEADHEKKDLWLKHAIREIKTTVTKHRAILYFEDESNISLSPVMGTSWAPKGKKISAYVTGNRDSLSAISAISRDGHLIFRLFDGSKRFNSDDIVNFFESMLRRHPRRHLVVVMDRATCHKSNKVKDFIKNRKRLHVYWLPSKSPEFNPDEQVWNYLKNSELKNHKETNRSGLKRLATKKLNRLAKSKSKTFGIFRRCEVADLYLR